MDLIRQGYYSGNVVSQGYLDLSGLQPFLRVTGVGRCLAGQNIVIDKENKRLAKPAVMQNVSGLKPPTILSSYRYQQLPTWCRLREPCPNGAFLATITQNNQVGNLPPQSRPNVPVSGLGLVTSN